MKLSFGERLKIRRLQTNKVDWQVISSQVGCTVAQAKDVVDQHYDPKFRRMAPAVKKRKKPKFSISYGQTMGQSLGENHVVNARVPEEVRAEKETREAAPYRSFSAEMFGEPRFGYSALDKKLKA